MEALFYVPMYSTREKCYMLQNTLQVNKTKTRAQVQKLIIRDSNLALGKKKLERWSQSGSQSTTNLEIKGS